MNKFSIGLLTVFIIFFTACSEDIQDPSGGIYGKVTNAQTGEVVPGATVTITPGGTSRTTGSDGTFDFTKLSAQQYVIQARKEGFVTNDKTINVVSGKDASGDITLTPEKKQSKLELSKSKLDFGTEESQLTFDVKNAGNTGSMDWTITGVTADWLTVSPMKGTLVSNKSQVVVVTLHRDKVKGHVKVTIVVNADGESLSVEVTADEKLARTVEANPNTLDFGEGEEKLALTLKSYNGSTNYTLKKKEAADWLGFSKTGGTIPQYDEANSGMKETIEVSVSRKDLNAGEYNATIILDSDLDDIEIPVRMTVKEVVKELKVQPERLDLATGESATFTMFATGADIAYSLLTQGNVAWVSFNKSSGTVKENSQETITVSINRESLAPGDYNDQIIVRAGTGDILIPISMTVEETVEEVQVPQGLYAYYQFEDNFDDSTENGFNGFGSNSPTFVDGIKAGTKAVKFSVSKDCSFNVPKPLTDSRDMTLCFWGKNFDDGNICYVTSSHQSQPIFTVSMSGGKLKFVVTLYNVDYQYEKVGNFTHPTLTDGGWHHIAITSDFSKTTYSTITSSLYVDGVLVDTITEDANVFTEGETGSNTYGSGVKFVMGGSVNWSNGRVKMDATNMAVDNLRVYNKRRLSADEIKTIYDAKQ